MNSIQSTKTLKLVRKAAAGLLIAIGAPIVLVSFVSLFDPNPGVRELAIIILAFVGLPPSAIGGWLLWGLRQQHEQEQIHRAQSETERIQQTFFHLLKENDGTITPLEFSMATQLPGAEAKQYLDARAKEFDATFDINPEGGIAYCFDLRQKKLASQTNEF